MTDGQRFLVEDTERIGTAGPRDGNEGSQAVSGETVLEQLVRTLMVLAVEHAGAERGLLILPYGDEHRIAAEARTGRDEVEVQLQKSPVTSSDLPDSLLRYVIRL